jgi:hypothetical protein
MLPNKFHFIILDERFQRRRLKCEKLTYFLKILNKKGKKWQELLDDQYICKTQIDIRRPILKSMSDFYVTDIYSSGNVSFCHHSFDQVVSEETFKKISQSETRIACDGHVC